MDYWECWEFWIWNIFEVKTSKLTKKASLLCGNEKRVILAFIPGFWVYLQDQYSNFTEKCSNTIECFVIKGYALPDRRKVLDFGGQDITTHLQGLLVEHFKTRPNEWNPDYIKTDSGTKN